jgi:hypothetical protein
VKSRARGSIIDCLNFLRRQIPSAVNSTGWNGYTTPSRAIVSELLLWRRNVWYNTLFVVRVRDPQATLTTNACKTGGRAELLLDRGRLDFIQPEGDDGHSTRLGALSPRDLGARDPSNRG